MWIPMAGGLSLIAPSPPSPRLRSRVRQPERADRKRTFQSGKNTARNGAWREITRWWLRTTRSSGARWRKRLGWVESLALRNRRNQLLIRRNRRSDGSGKMEPRQTGSMIFGTEANYPASMAGLIEHETGSSTGRTTLSFGRRRLLWRPWARMGSRIDRGAERRRDLREARDDP